MIFIAISMIVIVMAITIFLPNQNKSKLVEKSIAILPFDNLSPDKENQYFADGVVEDLLSKLSKIGELKVISRTSSEIFKDKSGKTIPEIAELLGVNYILEGSVQREKDNIRIFVQLIDAKEDDLGSIANSPEISGYGLLGRKIVRTNLAIWYSGEICLARLPTIE